MTDYLKQITFTIAPAATWTPPYTLPAAGQVVTIGTNTANSIQPAPGNWGYALFNTFGGGTYCQQYSQGGAFVIASSGGHTAPENTGAAIFDFEDATWKYLANANGIAVSLTPLQTSQTTGPPYGEILGATSGQIPSPSHLYTCSAWYIPPALGGGTKGSYLRTMGIATANQVGSGPFIAKGIHKMNLATGLWTRATNDLYSFSYPNLDGEFMGWHDTVLNRWYMMHPAIHTETRFPYLDSADWTIKFTSNFTSPPDPTGSGTWASMTFDPVRRAMLYFKDNMPLMAVDTQNFTAGYQVMVSAGPRPSTNQSRWIFYPTDGCFYTRTNTSGNTLYKLAPPAGGTLSGNWTFSTVVLGGAAMPNFTNAGANSTAHYTCWFYVPPLNCFAWVSGESSQVCLAKP